MYSYIDMNLEKSYQCIRTLTQKKISSMYVFQIKKIHIFVPKFFNQNNQNQKYHEDNKI